MKCGQCEFTGEYDGYLGHTCRTGYNPLQVEHHDALTNGRYSRQAAKAIARGEAKKEE